MMKTLEQRRIGPLTPAVVERVEADLLRLPQVDCPVVHRFGPGVYIRELLIPAGAFVIGHHHRHAHINIMLKGRIALLKEDGKIITLDAPQTLLGRPGRKVAFAITDVLWQNVYATEETDVATLEEMLFIKSETWQADNQTRLAMAQMQHQADREDFERMLDDIGMNAYEVQAISENERDQIPMPPDLECRVLIAPSPIHGKGVFVTADVAAGERIAPARIGGRRTPVGRYANHAARPNCRMEFDGQGDAHLVAVRALKGCAGGQPGDEATVDYRAVLALNLEQARKESPCLP